MDTYACVIWAHARAYKCYYNRDVSVRRCSRNDGSRVSLTMKCGTAIFID